MLLCSYPRRSPEPVHMSNSHKNQRPTRLVVLLTHVSLFVSPFLALLSVHIHAHHSDVYNNHNNNSSNSNSNSNNNKSSNSNSNNNNSYQSSGQWQQALHLFADFQRPSGWCIGVLKVSASCFIGLSGLGLRGFAKSSFVLYSGCFLLKTLSCLTM